MMVTKTEEQGQQLAESVQTTASKIETQVEDVSYVATQKASEQLLAAKEGISQLSEKIQQTVSPKTEETKEPKMEQEGKPTEPTETKKTGGITETAKEIVKEAVSRTAQMFETSPKESEPVQPKKETEQGVEPKKEESKGFLEKLRELPTTLTQPKMESTQTSMETTPKGTETFQQMPTGVAPEQGMKTTQPSQIGMETTRKTEVSTVVTPEEGEITQISSILPENYLNLEKKIIADSKASKLEQPLADQFISESADVGMTVDNSVLELQDKQNPKRAQQASQKLIQKKHLFTEISTPGSMESHLPNLEEIRTVPKSLAQEYGYEKAKELQQPAPITKDPLNDPVVLIPPRVPETAVSAPTDINEPESKEWCTFMNFHDKEHLNKEERIRAYEDTMKKHEEIQKQKLERQSQPKHYHYVGPEVQTKEGHEWKQASEITTATEKAWTNPEKTHTIIESLKEPETATKGEQPTQETQQVRVPTEERR